MLTKSSDDMRGKTVDVIIPVYKPGKKFRALMEMLFKQSVLPGKIILMYTKQEEEDHFDSALFMPDKKTRPSGEDSGIKEDPPGIPEVRVYELEKKDFDHGGTRNRGVSYSDAEFFLLMTDDAVPSNEFLIERLLEGFSREDTAVCYARQRPVRGASYAERFSRGFNYPGTSRYKTAEDIKTMGIKAFFCSNVCAMYRREYFDRLKGFVDRTNFNEDMIFARRALNEGYSIGYRAEARVIHSHDLSDPEQFKRNFSLAISQKEHPEIFKDVSSEKEGMKYIKKAYQYFKALGKSYLIIPFLVTSVYKYAGYRAGSFYAGIRGSFVRR